MRIGVMRNRIHGVLVVGAAVCFCLGCITSSVLAQSETSGRINGMVPKMESGKNAVGIFAWNISARSGAAVADSSLDFVIIDLEHSPYDVTRLETYLLGMVNKSEILKNGNLQPRVVPFVRVPAAGRERVQYR